MIDVDFNYKGLFTIIQCKKDDNFKNICQKYCVKIQADIKKLIFIYIRQRIRIKRCNKFNG